MSYTALYRKFRPAVFEDVKGQDAIVTTLKNQIHTGRIGHAYLFCGTRGTGKTTVAKIFARAVNCESPVDGNPCGTCETCRAIAAGASMNVVEMDAASNNGVDDVRQIREEVSYSPAKGNYKVYIIDEVHMLSTPAFNALLKTLEEPPSYVVFILATTDPQKLPLTILSRCQRYNFRRIVQDTITDRLLELVRREGVQAEEKALRYIARKGDGSMRDAISLLDQCIAFHIGQELTYDRVLEVLGAVDTDVYSRLLRAVSAQDPGLAVHILEQLVRQGADLMQFVSDFTWYMRNLMLLKSSDEMEDILDVSSENLKQLTEETAMIRQDTLMRYIREFSALSGQIRYASNRRVLIEMALIRLCRPEMKRDVQSILERIRRLEKLAEQGFSGSAPQITGGGYAGTGVPDRRAAAGADAPGAGTAAYAADAASSDAVSMRAVPEDLALVQTQWNAIVNDTRGMFKELLKQSEIRFNAKNPEDSALYVIFPNFIGERYTDDPARKQELEELIRARCRKQVEVRFAVSGADDIRREELGRIDIEKRVQDAVHGIEIDFE